MYEQGRSDHLVKIKVLEVREGKEEVEGEVR